MNTNIGFLLLVLSLFLMFTIIRGWNTSSNKSQKPVNNPLIKRKKVILCPNCRKYTMYLETTKATTDIWKCDMCKLELDQGNMKMR